MRSTDFSAIVSPIGTGSRRRKGALAQFAEGGAVDYTDADSTIAALNRSLSALQPKPGIMGRADPAGLAFSAGMLSPTRSGSFLESLGSAQRGQLAAIDDDQKRGIEVARLQMQAPLTGLQTAGLAQNLKRQKAIDDYIAGAPVEGGSPVGINAAGKSIAMPAVPMVGEEPPPIAAPRMPDVDDRPGAAAVAPGMDPGVPPGIDPRIGQVDTPPSPELRRGVTEQGPAFRQFDGQQTDTRPRAPAPQQRGAMMTTPSVEGAFPVPAPIAGQYATLFNRMAYFAKNPHTAELASKYETMIKGLQIRPGFMFLPDGSGIVPIGDKDPGYIERAKAANELMRPDGKGGYTFAPGVVAAQAGKAGAIKGAEEWAGVGPAAARERNAAGIKAEHALKEVEAPDGSKVMVPESAILQAQKRVAAGGDGSIAGVPTGPSGVGKERFKLDAEAQAGVIGATRDAAVSAAEELKSLNEMKGTIDRGLNTGAAAPYRQAVGKWLSEMGADEKRVKKLVGININDVTRFEQEAKALTLEAMKSKVLGSQPTNADRDFYFKTLPQITDTREAIKASMAYMEKRAAGKVEKWSAMREYERPTEQFPNGRDPRDFEIEWIKRTAPPRSGGPQQTPPADGGPARAPQGATGGLAAPTVPSAGTIVTNPAGQHARVNADGTVTPLP